VKKLKEFLKGEWRKGKEEREKKAEWWSRNGDGGVMFKGKKR
jgi:hypothetical protein